MSVLLLNRARVVSAGGGGGGVDPWLSQEPSGSTRLWEPGTWVDPVANFNGDYTAITGHRYANLGTGPLNRGNLISTPTAPRKATSVGQLYVAGEAAQPTMQIFSMPGDTAFDGTYVRLYTCLVFRYDAGFVFHPNGVKQFYNSLKDGGGGWGSNTFEVTTAPVGAVDSGEFIYRITSYVSPTTNFSTNINTTPLATGVWHMMQMECVAGDPDVTNGSVRIWVASYDGSSWGPSTLRMEHTNIKTTRPDYTKAWAKVNLNGYFGGSGGTNLPANQYHTVNAVYVSGRAS